MAVETIEIKELMGEKNLGHTFKNLYILNRGSSGRLIINDTFEIDIEDIDLLEDVNVHRIKWNLDSLKTLILFVSDEYLKIRGMLVDTREKSEYLLFYDQETNSGVTTLWEIQPPEGEVYIIRNFHLEGYLPSSSPTLGSYNLNLKIDNYPNGELTVALFKWDYSVIPRVVSNEGVGIDASSMPPSGKIPDNLIITHSLPLQVRFTNSTDADITVTIAMLIEVKEVVT